MTDINITIDDKDAGLIMHALAELPARVSMNLIIKLRAQLVARAQASADAGADKKEE